MASRFGCSYAQAHAALMQRPNNKRLATTRRDKNVWREFIALNYEGARTSMDTKTIDALGAGLHPLNF